MKKNYFMLYSFLSRFLFPKSYTGKIALIIFFGIHIPLFTLIFYFALSYPLGFGATWRILMIALIATLLGTGIALYTLYIILTPLSLTSREIHEYVTNKKMPDLPTHFTDQGGRLMADVQYTIEKLDEVIKSLKELSRIDYLTGVYNRYSCEERLSEGIARVQRSNDIMSLVILDVDNLKLINDRYGHGTGDICLKHIASIIKNNIRKSDWIARWGGDEFVLVLFSSKEEPSAKILGRISTAIEQNPQYSPQGDVINLTLSMGVYQYSSEDNIETLFTKMDDALYEAKRGGKNQIVYYGQDSSSPVQLEFFKSN